MLFRRFLLFIICSLFTASLFAQGFEMSGSVFSKTDSFEAAGATIRIFKNNDSVAFLNTVAEDNGSFVIEHIPSGKYLLKCSYLGSKTLSRNITVADANVDLGRLWMESSAKELKNVTIVGTETRMEQLGDTAQFNAAAYKTNPDATAEDLVAKMPGITSDNTGVKVNGQTVNKVLIDGKPFFGTDPSLALKSLPAEVIDKIQVFDQMSEQSQFTGFDDGNTQKTINIRTKSNKSNGQFGKVYAGYGSDDRYSVGGNMNYFEGNRRISINALSNNINLQNFSSEDLLGAQSGGGGRGNAANNFMVGQQNGVTTTTSFGLNYSDVFGKNEKIKISGSYFYNNTKNLNNSVTSRNFFTTNDTGLFYNETNSATATNTNHRFNLRLEYNIDSFNSFVLTPSFSLQTNNTTSNLLGNTTLTGDIFQSTTQNANSAKSTGYNFANSLLYRHKFQKVGRTFSFDFGTKLNEKNSNTKLYNLSQYLTDTTLLDQEPTLYANGYTFSGNAIYTEPINKKSQLMLNYNPSFTKNRSDKEANSFDPVNNDYSILDTFLSSKYDNTYIVQSGGLSYRYNDKKGNLMVGANLQNANLSGDAYFPYSNHIERSFVNLLPQAMYNYKFDKGTNLRLMYRANTQAPSIAQLQDVVDVSNPLFLSAGNPDLKQSYTHTITARYGKTRAQKGKGLFFFASGGYTQNYFGTASYIPTKDSVLANNIVLNRGSQYSVPVNLDGYWNIRSFATYGIPFNAIKSNLNLNGGYTFTRSPSLINDVANFANTNTINAGVVLSSNISENIDFTFSYNGNYNIVKNTLQSTLNNNYFYHNASFKINWIFLKRFVLNTSINQSLYEGLSNSYNQQFFLWNAYVAYKFLKNKSLEAKFSAYDILKQNKNITRNITNTYIEDVRTQALTQYFMFTLTYTLRNFKGNPPAPADDHDHNRPEGGQWRGGGGRPDGGF
jgi:hypothetical protein